MSIGLIELQIHMDVLILDVTVHEDEASDERELKTIAVDRARKHARNLVALMRGDLSKFAGMGLRQGRPDVGPII
ncbi:MAG: riboflavin synthase, partial [Thermoproteus sp.]